MNARLDFFNGKFGGISILDGVRELEQSQEANFGLIMESLSAEYMLQDRCDFYTMGSLATRFYSFGLPKGMYCSSKFKILDWHYVCQSHDPILGPILTFVKSHFPPFFLSYLFFSSSFFLSRLFLLL